MHGSAEERDLAPVPDPGIHDLLDPMDVGGETGGDATDRGVADDVGDGSAHRALGRLESRLLGVGGIGEQESHPASSQCRQGGEVGGDPVDRRRVQLEVPGVEDDSLRSLQGNRSGVGHRVGDGDHLETEGRVVDPLLGRDRAQVGVETRLLDPTPRQLDGELGPVDRDVEVLEEVGESPDMVLVAMGQDHALDVPRPGGEPCPVGKHQVDAEHVLLGEHQPTVDECDLAVDLHCGTVAADLPETTEKGDRDAHRP